MCCRSHANAEPSALHLTVVSKCASDLTISDAATYALDLTVVSKMYLKPHSGDATCALHLMVMRVRRGRLDHATVYIIENVREMMYLLFILFYEYSRILQRRRPVNGVSSSRNV